MSSTVVSALPQRPSSLSNHDYRHNNDNANPSPDVFQQHLKEYDEDPELNLGFCIADVWLKSIDHIPYDDRDLETRANGVESGLCMGENSSYNNEFLFQSTNHIPYGDDDFEAKNVEAISTERDGKHKESVILARQQQSNEVTSMAPFRFDTEQIIKDKSLVSILRNSNHAGDIRNQYDDDGPNDKISCVASVGGGNESGKNEDCTCFGVWRYHPTLQSLEHLTKSRINLYVSPKRKDVMSTVGRQHVDAGGNKRRNQCLNYLNHMFSPRNCRRRLSSDACNLMNEKQKENRRPHSNKRVTWCSDEDLVCEHTIHISPDEKDWKKSHYRLVRSVAKQRISGCNNASMDQRVDELYEPTRSVSKSGFGAVTFGRIG